MGVQGSVSPSKGISYDQTVAASPLRSERRPSHDDKAVRSTAEEHATTSNSTDVPIVGSTSKRPLPPLPPKPVSIRTSKYSATPQTNHAVPSPSDTSTVPPETSSEPPHVNHQAQDTSTSYPSIDDLLHSEVYTPLPPTVPSTTAHTPLPARDRNPLLARRTHMPARASPSGNEPCAGCGKTVYFAEGVSAPFITLKGFGGPRDADGICFGGNR